MPNILNYINGKVKVFLIALFVFSQNSNLTIHSIVPHKKKIGRFSSFLLHSPKKSITSDGVFFRRTIFTSHLMERKHLHPYFITQFRFLSEKNNFNTSNTAYNDLKKTFSTTLKKKKSKTTKDDTKVIFDSPKKPFSMIPKGGKTAAAKKVPKKPGNFTAIKKEKTEPKDGETKKVKKKYAKKSIRKTKSTLETGRKLLRDVLKDLKEDKVEGIDTGIKGLNSLVDEHHLKGWRPGELIVIAAGTGEGKTTLMVNFAIDAFKDFNKKGAVLFFSVEMQGAVLMKKIIVRELSRMGIKKPESGFKEIENSKTIEAMSWMDDSFIIDSSPDLMPSNIYEKSHDIMDKQGLKAVFVDYSQRIDPEEKHQNRERDVRDVAKFLKSLAVDLNVPVITGAQINRNKEIRREIRREVNAEIPKISDLRESDSLGHEADIVIFIQSPTKGTKKYPENYIDLYLSKNRHGKTGKLSLIFDKDAQDFIEIKK